MKTIAAVVFCLVALFTTQIIVACGNGDNNGITDGDVTTDGGINPGDGGGGEILHFTIKKGESKNFEVCGVVISIAWMNLYGGDGYSYAYSLTNKNSFVAFALLNYKAQTGSLAYGCLGGNSEPTNYGEFFFENYTIPMKSYIYIGKDAFEGDYDYYCMQDCTIEHLVSEMTLCKEFDITLLKE